MVSQVDTLCAATNLYTDRQREGERLMKTRRQILNGLES